MRRKRRWSLSLNHDFGRGVSEMVASWPEPRRAALERMLADIESDGLTGRLAAIANRVAGGCYERAGVLHDACCRLAGDDWAARRDADRLFWMAMNDLGRRHALGRRGRAAALAIWAGVRLFAWVHRACARCGDALYAVAAGR